ncbi:MAG: hypothetical protein HYT07_00695 [Candidatus Levybacteria bacterium]|nr:hypothetical protein [Candidatus Levybacteria bacterium]
MDSQTQGQQSANTDISSQSTNSNQWLRTLGIGFGIVSFGIAIGVIGYLLGTKQNQTVVQNQQSSVVPTLSQPSPTAIDETANWKTYTDDKYSFQFKYPSEWVIASKLDNALEGVARYIALTDPLLSESASLVFSIQIKPNSSYSNELTKTKADIGASEEHNIVISGIDGKKYSTVGEATGPGPDKLSSYVLPLNGGSFLITIAPEQENKNYTATIDQILSTFKFVD